MLSSECIFLGGGSLARRLTWPYWNVSSTPKPEIYSLDQEAFSFSRPSYLLEYSTFLKTLERPYQRKSCWAGFFIPDFSVGVPEVALKSSHVYMVQVRGHPLKRPGDPPSTEWGHSLAQAHHCHMGIELLMHRS